MDVWFSNRRGTTAERHERELKHLRILCTRFSEARRESFCPLDTDLSWRSACHPCRESWARSRHLLQIVDEEAESENLKPKGKRGSFEGAIRIPLHASLFLFIDLAFLAIPRKSFGFLTLLFSIPTAPTKASFFSIG